jgi:hypothetical protein
MKIACHCGAVIPDQTDFLSYKAHVVADQDWEDFVDASESKGRIDSSLVRLSYQCPQCGRLYVEDASRALHAFVPDEHKVQVLGSSEGADWRAPLIGSWNDKPYAHQAKGHLWCGADGGTSTEFDDWNQLELAYQALFKRLRELNRLRSALLRKNGQDVHSWAWKA